MKDQGVVAGVVVSSVAAFVGGWAVGIYYLVNHWERDRLMVLAFVALWGICVIAGSVLVEWWLRAERERFDGKGKIISAVTALLFAGLGFLFMINGVLVRYMLA